MGSIWLDEDPEEKLYSIQAQVLMDADGDELQNIVFLNSKKPLLNNRKNIELPPLAAELTAGRDQSGDYKCQVLSPQRRASRRSILKLFSQDKGRRRVPISTPYNFQHISHANGLWAAAETREIEREQLQKELSRRTALTPKLKEHVLRTPPRITSKPEFSQSPSTRSSSTDSTSPSGVMSASATPYSLDESASFGEMEHFSEVDGISLEDFRNYNFPSLMIDPARVGPAELKPIDVSVNGSQSSSVLDLGSAVSESPDKRISVQDILRFYAGSTKSTLASHQTLECNK